MQTTLVRVPGGLFRAMKLAFRVDEDSQAFIVPSLGLNGRFLAYKIVVDSRSRRYKNDPRTTKSSRVP
jgi:hypothetical protein